MIVTPITLGAFQENCYLLCDDDAGASVLIDPGSEPEKIIPVIERSGARLEAIWLTHAHVDHIGGIAGVIRRWKVPVFLHPLDEPLYRMGGRQAQLYGIPYEEPPPTDSAFTDGQVLTVGKLEFDVMHAPGHAPGHVVIQGNGVAFVGDCLFAGSIGRTDLPFSKAADLAISLGRIAELPPETVVYPGHGMSTTIGEERESNPFLNGSVRIVGDQ